jgi:hypothetical protein
MRLLAISIVGMIATSALAEDIVSFTNVCRFIDRRPPEVLTDHENHFLSASTFTCHAQSGPLVGAISIGTSFYELERGIGYMLMAGGIYRKPPHTIVVYKLENGKSTSTDGKTTGFRTEGTGLYLIATDDAKSLNGRSFSYVTATTANPDEFTWEVTLDK